MRVYAPVYYPVDRLALFTPPAPLEPVDPGLYRGLDRSPENDERGRSKDRFAEAHEMMHVHRMTLIHPERHRCRGRDPAIGSSLSPLIRRQ